MSSGLMQVRFADGTVKYGCYHGTSDIAEPALHDREEDWRKGSPDAWEFTEGDGEPVEVATNYGSGGWWRATATRTHLTSGHEPWGSEDQMGNQIAPYCWEDKGHLPDWWVRGEPQ